MVEECIESVFIRISSSDYKTGLLTVILKLVFTGVFLIRPSLDAVTVGGSVHFRFGGQAATKHKH